MGLSVATARRFLSRKEAATYLSENWFRCSVSRLAKLAFLKQGPDYGREQGTGRSGYTRENLDRWAAGVYRPVLSTRSCEK